MSLNSNHTHKGKGNRHRQNQRRNERRKRLPEKQAENYRLIDGNITRYPLAYCRRKQAYLSLGLYELHRCAEKECSALIMGLYEQEQ